MTQLISIKFEYKGIFAIYKTDNGLLMFKKIGQSEIPKLLEESGKNEVKVLGQGNEGIKELNRQAHRIARSLSIHMMMVSQTETEFKARWIKVKGLQ